MEKKKVAVLCAAVAATACFVMGLFMYYYMSSRQPGGELRVGDGSYSDIAKYMDISDLENIIRNNYYKDVEEQKLIDGALKGMVDSLDDPYSVYYTEEEYKDYTAKNEGKFVGVGIVVAPNEQTGELLVHSVYKGGPAYEAGMNSGEVITTVDGISVAGLDYESAANLVTGPSGSSVKLTTRTADGQQKEYNLVRTEVQTPYVFYNMLDDKVAYIVISQFHGASAQEFADAIKAITEEEEAKGLIIDLRGNMGGSIKDANDMLNLILPEGVTVYSINRDGDRKEWTSDSQYNDIPLVVLVNGNSASASEIFAGAIQDFKRGTIIGTQTYGKGVTQTIIDMPYSGGGVKITNAVYYTPNGRDLNGVGITPDIVVDMPEDSANLTQETDIQLQTALQAIREKI